MSQEELKYKLNYYYDDWSDNTDWRHQIQFRYNERWIDFGSFLFESLAFEIINWTTDNFGERGNRWEISKNNSTLYFENVEDVMSFKLRWI